MGSLARVAERLAGALKGDPAGVVDLVIVVGGGPADELAEEEVHCLAHAPSAARYQQECLPRAEYRDVPVAEQTRENTPDRILAFHDAPVWQVPTRRR